MHHSQVPMLTFVKDAYTEHSILGQCEQYYTLWYYILYCSVGIVDPRQILPKLNLIAC